MRHPFARRRSCCSASPAASCSTSARGGAAGLDATFDFFSGNRALDENLQLDRSFEADRLQDPVLYASLGTVFNTDPKLLRTFATALAPLKPRREEVPKDKVLCEYCTAKCCRYFALPMETPTTWQDFDYLRWFMMHGRVSVFVEGETWYLMVHAECRHLLPDNRCGTYDTRPAI